MGFFIWIAVAVCIWVYFGMSFYNDSENTRKEIKKRGGIVGWLLLILGQILLCLAILWGIIYLFYLLIKAIDWDVIGMIVLWILFIAWYIFFISRLYKITHKNKS